MVIDGVVPCIIEAMLTPYGKRATEAAPFNFCLSFEFAEIFKS